MVFAALFSPRGPSLRLYETDATDADPACHFLLPVRIASAAMQAVSTLSLYSRQRKPLTTFKADEKTYSCLV